MKLDGDLSIGQKQVVWAWGFLALPILFYSVILFYPAAEAIVRSFQCWNRLSDPERVGMENYVRLWADPEFW